jgi:hypothetical protein
VEKPIMKMTTITSPRAALILLLVAGCGTPERAAPGGKTETTSLDDAGGGGSGGKGGAPARPDTGVSSGGSGGGAMVRADAAPDTALMSSLDTAPSGGGDTWAKCGPESFKPGISAAEFCAHYASVCKFDASGGSAGMSRFKSLEDCTTKYNGLTDTPRGGRACVAYHLCVAGADPSSTDVFCPHVSEAPMMSGPCKMAYL